MKVLNLLRPTIKKTHALFFFNFIGKDDVRALSILLHKEHPQIIALVLANIDPYYSYLVIRSMQNEMRSDVILRISLLKEVPLDIIKTIATIIEKKLKPELYYYQADTGLNIVSRIFKYFSNKVKKQIIDLIRDNNDVAAYMIRNVIKRGRLCQTEL